MKLSTAEEKLWCRHMRDDWEILIFFGETEYQNCKTNEISYKKMTVKYFFF